MPNTIQNTPPSADKPKVQISPSEAINEALSALICAQGAVDAALRAVKHLSHVETYPKKIKRTESDSGPDTPQKQLRPQTQKPEVAKEKKSSHRTMRNPLEDYRPDNDGLMFEG